MPVFCFHQACDMGGVQVSAKVFAGRGSVFLLSTLWDGHPASVCKSVFLLSTCHRVATPCPECDWTPVTRDRSLSILTPLTCSLSNSWFIVLLWQHIQWQIGPWQFNLPHALSVIENLSSMEDPLNSDSCHTWPLPNPDSQICLFLQKLVTSWQATREQWPFNLPEYGWTQMIEAELQKRANRANLLVLIFHGRC